MHFIAINALSKVPLYQQIIDSIDRAIQEGWLRHLDPLPTQHQLEHTFFISSIVVKQAYALLRSQGKIITIQGKGSFIYLRPKLVIDYDLFTPKTAKKFEKMQLKYQGTKLLSEQLMLHFSIHEPQKAFCFKRLGYHQNFPVLYQTMFILENKKSKEVNALIEQSPYRLLPSLPSLDVKMTYKPDVADAEVSNLLNINPNDPVHSWMVMIYKEKKVLGIARYYVPAEQIVLHREE
jgi:DNA-binding GntR family transcriptional regulator